LTTHVLDTAHGCSGAGIAVRLYADDSAVPLVETRTNADGRCDAPLLTDAAMKPGRYVLEFEAGAYFRSLGVTLAEPPFLDVVRIAFGISDSEAHYHVPLLVSPYGYSTYRGS
jgi:5-hydroxyisourate hydrolase